MADQPGQPNASGIAFRRQALNACDACRRRKTKCDEQRPHCSRCTRLSLECVYVETVAAKKNLSVTELADTLQRMDDKLGILTQFVQQADFNPRQTRLQSSTSFVRPALGVSSPNNGGSSNPEISMNDDASSSLASLTPGVDKGRFCDELSLSHRHSVAPQHLLTWPCSPLYLSELELHYPTEVEVNRPKMTQSSAPPRCIETPIIGESWLSRLSLSQLHALTSFYFDHFHPSCLVLDEAAFYSQNLSTAMRTNFAKSFSTSIVLLVCALGSIAAYYSGCDEWSQIGEDDVGVGFFNLASNMIRDIEATNWVSVQCLLLMGTFLSAKLRVHDAWVVIHRACYTILILVQLQHNLEAQHCQLYWIAYLQESQILAEFDFPASGLGKLSGSTALPLVPEANTEPHYAQYQFFFLALISMRRLLNRVLNNIYTSENDEVHAPQNDNPLILPSASRAIVHELDRQLEEWRECLPSGLRFPAYCQDQEAMSGPFLPRSTEERLRGHLIARYYSAKSIIHRPFVYRAFHCEDPSQLSDTEKTGIRTAIGAAFMSTAHSGLLNEPLMLLLHPINSCRSLFALELQIMLVLRNNALHFALPNEWRTVQGIRDRITEVARRMSPTVSRDFEIIESLM